MPGTYQSSRNTLCLNINLDAWLPRSATHRPRSGGLQYRSPPHSSVKVRDETFNLPEVQGLTDNLIREALQGQLLSGRDYQGPHPRISGP